MVFRAVSCIWIITLSRLIGARIRLRTFFTLFHFVQVFTLLFLNFYSLEDFLVIFSGLDVLLYLVLETLALVHILRAEDLRLADKEIFVHNQLI